MFKVCVCDDEQIALKYISNKIQNCFQNAGIDITLDRYEKSHLLRQDILNGASFDIIFLDIDMPDMSGLELSRLLRTHTNNSLIIFVSNHENYVFESLKVQPFYFIRKNKFNEEIEQVIHDIIRELQKPAVNTIVLNVNKSLLSLDPLKIIYAEYNRKTLSIVTTKNTYNIKYTLASLEEQLKEFGFIRIHKSILVNYRYIYHIEHGEVILDNDTHLPVSRYRITDVKKTYKGLIMI